MTQWLTMRLTDEQREALKARASTEGRPVAEIVRRALLMTAEAEGWHFPS